MQLTAKSGVRVSSAFAARKCVQAVCLGLWIFTGNGFADAGNSVPIHFDIPAQPLGDALEAYARLAGREVLYDGALAAGRHSAVLDGVYRPAEALLLLLQGTGLTAEFKDKRFFVLSHVAPSSHEKAGHQNPDAVRQTYYGRIQAALRAAFCEGYDVRPGEYRVAVRLWIDDRGHVSRYERLSSTGRGALDNAVDTALRGLRIGMAPPDMVTQPVTIVVLPHAAGTSRDCVRSAQSGEGL